MSTEQRAKRAMSEAASRSERSLPIPSTSSDAWLAAAARGTEIQAGVTSPTIRGALPVV